jgi:hypothetical protein
MAKKPPEKPTVKNAPPRSAMLSRRRPHQPHGPERQGDNPTAGLLATSASEWSQPEERSYPSADGAEISLDNIARKIAYSGDRSLKVAKGHGLVISE